MPSFTLLALACAATSAPPQGVGGSSPNPPTLGYWHSYVAADGKAYFAQCKFTNFSTSSIGPGVVPSWHETLDLGALGAKVAVFPVGHVAPWHVDPVVQMIQVLSGSVQWELSGENQTKVFAPGDLYIEEDHLAKNVSGRYGHVTSNVGDTPAVFLMLQSALAPTAEQPCRFH